MCVKETYFTGGGGGGGERKKSMKRIHFLKIYLLFFLCDVHFPTCLFFFFFFCVCKAGSYISYRTSFQQDSLPVCVCIYLCMFVVQWFFVFFLVWFPNAAVDLSVYS